MIMIITIIITIIKDRPRGMKIKDQIYRLNLSEIIEEYRQK